MSSIQMAEPVNRVMFTTAAARDFVSGITSSVSGYKILTGNTIGSANIHINMVISIGLLILHKATKPNIIATIVITMIDTLKHRF